MNIVLMMSNYADCSYSGPLSVVPLEGNAMDSRFLFILTYHFLEFIYYFVIFAGFMEGDGHKQQEINLSRCLQIKIKYYLLRLVSKLNMIGYKTVHWKFLNTCELNRTVIIKMILS